MQARFGIEDLENRKLLSASLAETTLMIGATDEADEVVVTVKDEVATVKVNDQTSSFDTDDFTSIDIRTAGGNDVIRLDANVLKMTYLDGGDGDNVLDFSPADGVSISTEAAWQWQNVQTLRGSAGDDDINIFSQGARGIQVIEAGAGNDTVVLFRTAEGATVNGNDGNDTIEISAPGYSAVYLGGDGNDTFQVHRSSNTARDFHGQGGIDKVDYTPFNTSEVVVTIDDAAGDGVIDGRDERLDNVHTDIEILIGGQLNDTLIGSSGNETLDGGMGDDVINGNGGADSIVSSDGSDTVVGSGGGDGAGTAPAPVDPAPVGSPTAPATRKPQRVIVSSAGVLTVTASSKSDQIAVTQLNSRTLSVSVNGETTRVPVKKVSSIRIDAGAGNDRVRLDQSSTLRIATRINGGSGNDTLMGDAGNDRINGGSGNDYINGGAGNDVVYGEAGNDRLYGGGGKDHLYAGAGADLLRGGDGKDQLFLAVAKRADIRDNPGDRIVYTLL